MRNGREANRGRGFLPGALPFATARSGREDGPTRRLVVVFVGFTYFVDEERPFSSLDGWLSCLIDDDDDSCVDSVSVSVVSVVSGVMHLFFGVMVSC